MAEKMVSLNASRTMMERVRLFVESLVSETANLIPTKTSDLTNDAGFITGVESLSDIDIDDAIAGVFGRSYLWTIKMNNTAAMKLSDEAGNEVHIWKYASSDSVSVDSTAPDAEGPIGDPFTYTLDTSSISFVPTRLSVYGVGKIVEVSVIAEIICDSETFLSYTPGENYADILNPSQNVSFEITMAVSGAV